MLSGGKDRNCNKLSEGEIILILFFFEIKFVNFFLIKICFEIDKIKQ